MKLATLLGWSLAASLLAACSGGAGGVAPGSSANTGNSAPVQGLALRIGGVAIGAGANASARRSPAFIGTNVTTIAYTITPGPISGSFTGSGTTFAGCSASGTPVTQTCDITIAPGTYAITVTLKDGTVAVGSGTASNVVVTSGNTTSPAISINPINSGPVLSIPTGPTQFYNDATMQTITLDANEVDPAGDIITTYYGPVGNYPALSFMATGGLANITLPANIAALTPPGVGAQLGYNAESLTYTGSGNSTSLGVTLSDGTSTSSVTIPYVSLANNANNPTAGNITFGALGVAVPVTVTESTSAASGGLDANFHSTAATCAGLATFSPLLGINPTTTAGPTASVTYMVTATNAGTPTCTMNVASVEDPSLTTAITLNFPGTIGATIGSNHRR